jgi:hypothetical protein
VEREEREVVGEKRAITYPKNCSQSRTYYFMWSGSYVKGFRVFWVSKGWEECHP